MSWKSKVALSSIGVWLADVVPAAYGAPAYTPEEQVLSRLSRSAALRQARAALGDAEHLHAGARDIGRSSLRVSAKEIQFSEDRVPKVLSFAQVEPAAIKVERMGVRVTELALVPDAANARAAQDKMYEWEAKAGKR